MGSIFKRPKMPPLPPPPPAPEPPSEEISAEEKERIAKEQARVRRNRKGRTINNTNWSYGYSRIRRRKVRITIR